MCTKSKCGLCHQKDSKYTCPKCQIEYCSLVCYKSDAHLQCSENFFKQCIIQELETKSSDKNKVKKDMEDILRKLQREEEEALDSDDSSKSDDDLEERLRNVDLDLPDEVWARLNDNERKEFQTLVDSDQITQCLPEWQPWWISDSPGLVEEINSCQSASLAIPKIKDDVPLLSALMKKKPATEAVICGLMNLLYGYACISRLFLHDWELINVKPAIETLLMISENLSIGVNFQSAVEAVEHAQITACNKAQISTELSLAAKTDVPLLLKRPNFVMASLSDLHHLMERGTTCFPKRRLLSAIKKIEFYLSFVKEYGLGIV